MNAALRLATHAGLARMRGIYAPWRGEDSAVSFEAIAAGLACLRGR